MAKGYQESLTPANACEDSSTGTYADLSVTMRLCLSPKIGTSLVVAYSLHKTPVPSKRSADNTEQAVSDDVEETSKAIQETQANQTNRADASVLLPLPTTSNNPQIGEIYHGDSHETTPPTTADGEPGLLTDGNLFPTAGEMVEESEEPLQRQFTDRPFNASAPPFSAALSSAASIQHISDIRSRDSLDSIQHTSDIKLRDSLDVEVTDAAGRDFWATFGEENAEKITIATFFDALMDFLGVDATKDDSNKLWTACWRVEDREIQFDELRAVARCIEQALCISSIPLGITWELEAPKTAPAEPLTDNEVTPAAALTDNVADQIKGPAKNIVASTEVSSENVTGPAEPPTEKSTENVVGATENDPMIGTSQPTFIRVHPRYLETQTLDKYNLPWEYDSASRPVSEGLSGLTSKQGRPDYIIIKKYINRDFQEELFNHTRKLREELKLQKYCRAVVSNIVTDQSINFESALCVVSFPIDAV